MQNTQIIFVGHHKEKLLESIKALHEFPCKKIILIVGEPISSGENKARRISKEIKNELETIWEVQERKINKKNVLTATFQLLDLIIKENKEGFNVLINASGSLRTFAIAAYIACSCTRSRLITSIPRYDEQDNEVGIEEIIELPLVPVNFPTEEQKKILFGIQDQNKSLKDLIIELNSTISIKKGEFQKERSRISHHLANLEEILLIKRTKVGKNVMINLTFLGKVMVKLFTSVEKI